MASINVEAASDRRRSVNHDLPLIPCIDFLLCLVAFLLVTAVWSQMARLGAHARVPGRPDEPPVPGEPRVLHVGSEGSRSFWLVWREGSTVYRRVDVEKKGVPFGEGDLRYPALAQAVAAEWREHGSHRKASDPRLDQAVLHTSNATPFAELAAVLDALNQPARELDVAPGQQVRVPAFQVAFAVD